MNSDLNLTEREELSRLREELRKERELPSQLLDVHAICDQRDKAVAERDALREENEKLKQPLPKWCVDLAELFNRTAIEERDKAKHELREVKAENERLKGALLSENEPTEQNLRERYEQEVIPSLRQQLAERDAEIAKYQEAVEMCADMFDDMDTVIWSGDWKPPQETRAIVFALSRTKPAEEKE